jgi:hypothetical protein
LRKSRLSAVCGCLFRLPNPLRFLGSQKLLLAKRGVKAGHAGCEVLPAFGCCNALHVFRRKEMPSA